MMMMSSTCCTRKLPIVNLLQRVPIKSATTTTTRRRIRPLPGGGWPDYDVFCFQVPIIVIQRQHHRQQQQQQQQQCSFFSSTIPSSFAIIKDNSSMIKQRHQTTEERRQIHHQDFTNKDDNDDDDKICDKEELEEKELEEQEQQEEDITKEERKDWSLKEISNIDRWDHPQMPQIIDDIAYRLQYQSELIENLHKILDNNIRKGPILLSSMPSSTSSGSSSSSSSSPITSNGMMLRPYWWTIQQESQLIQEIDKQQREIQNLQRLYKDTYKQIQQYQSLLTNSNKNNNNNHRHLLFKLFGEIYSRHALTIETFAEIVISLKQIQRPKSFNDIINELLLQERLGMLLLCDHITQICKPTKPTLTKKPNTTKAKSSSSSSSSSPIAKNEDIVDIVSKAVTEAKHLCEVHYLTSPSIHVIENKNATTTTEEEEARSSSSSSNNGDDGGDFFIVKPWLQYTLVELLKNSMSVTIERNRTTSSLQAQEKSKEDDHSSEQEEDHEVLYYPIYINVEETQTMVRINIYDQGGGIISGPKKNQKKLFEFAQHIKKWDRMDDQQTYAMTRSPLQGLGVGLSMSKMMMEYFGGTLSLEDRHDHDRDYDYCNPSLVISNNEEPTATTTTTTTEKLLLERGVTATIVLPKDTTIVEKKKSSHLHHHLPHPPLE